MRQDFLVADDDRPHAANRASRVARSAVSSILSRDVCERCILFINERGRMKRSLGKYEDVPVRKGIPRAEWHHFVICRVFPTSKDLDLDSLFLQIGVTQIVRFIYIRYLHSCDISVKRGRFTSASLKIKHRTVSHAHRAIESNYTRGASITTGGSEQSARRQCIILRHT
jgi:hypothetical protein